MHFAYAFAYMSAGFKKKKQILDFQNYWFRKRFFTEHLKDTNRVLTLCHIVGYKYLKPATLKNSLLIEAIGFDLLQ